MHIYIYIYIYIRIRILILLLIILIPLILIMIIGEFFSPCPSGEECIRQTRSIPPRQVHPGRSALSVSEAVPRSYPATSRAPSRRRNGEGLPRTETRPVRDVLVDTRTHSERKMGMPRWWKHINKHTHTANHQQQSQ